MTVIGMMSQELYVETVTNFCSKTFEEPPSSHDFKNLIFIHIGAK